MYRVHDSRKTSRGQTLLQISLVELPTWAAEKHKRFCRKDSAKWRVLRFDAADAAGILAGADLVWCRQPRSEGGATLIIYNSAFQMENHPQE